jgi:tetratricopeptide (TPR) repeat protein
MNCPNCGNEVSIQKNSCERCGQDLVSFQKAYKISNGYYNIGLSKAKVRDLTGAIFVLKKSLEINKRNVNARNLLGLVYFEMGETVSALSEWVISKHFDENNADTDRYINALQSNPTKLDLLNQTIKKYNQALISAKQGDDDLAIIQLKKVISLNSHFVKALQLISLLYMHNNEYDKAKKHLLRAKKIDISNTTTLRYLKEIKEHIVSSGNDYKKSKKEKKAVKTPSTTYVSTPYKEDKPNIWLFVNLVAGIVIGVVASAILILPTVRNQATSEFRDREVEYNAEISKNKQFISTLEKGNEELEAQIGQLQAELEEYTKIDDSIYDKLFQVIQTYVEGISQNELDSVEVADALSEIDVTNFDKPHATAIYNGIKDNVMEDAAKELYDQGYSLYSSGNYDEALPILVKSYEYNSLDVNAIYFLGRTYQRLDDNEKAKEYYNIIVEDFPGTRRAREARSQLRRLE